MFGSAVRGTPVMDTPQIEEMVRARGKLPQAEALAYAAQLDDKSAASGCYVVHLERPCSCPVACFYNCSKGDCLWPGCGTIPFGCCIILNKTITDGTHYINAKGDTLVVKVDAKHETLACYVNDCGTGPCCYCVKA